MLFAARGGRLGEVAELLNNPALDLMYENGEFNENALHWACKKGHSAIVALLLTRDEVDINRIASKGKTALSFACEGNHAICIRLLLQDSCWKHNDNSELDLCARSFGWTWCGYHGVDCLRENHRS